MASIAGRTGVYLNFLFWIALAAVGSYVIWPMKDRPRRGIDLVGGFYITLKCMKRIQGSFRLGQVCAHVFFNRLKPLIAEQEDKLCLEHFRSPSFFFHFAAQVFILCKYRWL